MLDKKIIYKRSSDEKEVEGRLIRSFSHTNEGYGQTKDIALIFYEDVINSGWSQSKDITRLVFRYVEIDDVDLKIFDEPSIYPAETEYDLIKKYASMQYYIEDWLYNFVNYSGIKF